MIMSQTDDIHESFYDLFNQHFRRIDDPEGGPRYFTNIAIGAHLKPSRVDQKFQCIVVVKESEIKNTPAPFLNRFEKYYISHTNLLNLVLKELPPCLRVITNVVYKKVSTVIDDIINETIACVDIHRWKHFTHCLARVHSMVVTRKRFVHFYSASYQNLGINTNQ